MSFLNPKKIISSLAIIEGSTVVDFGFGSGAFLEFLLKEAGESGKVFAFDIQEDIIKRVENDYEEKNIIFKQVDLEEETSTQLKDESVDLVVISALLFQVEKKKHILKEAYRILKPNGRILFIE